MPCGIPCRVGYRAARDTVPYGIPCRAGYHAAWDTESCGVGYHAVTMWPVPVSRRPVPAQMWPGIFPRMRPTRPAARGFSAPCARARRLRRPHTLRIPTVLSGYRMNFTVPTAPSECPQYPHLLGLLDDVVDQVHDDAYLDPGLHCTALHCTAWHGNRSRDTANGRSAAPRASVKADDSSELYPWPLLVDVPFSATGANVGSRFHARTRARTHAPQTRTTRPPARPRPRRHSLGRRETASLALTGMHR
jgi:hypothetical protein